MHFNFGCLCQQMRLVVFRTPASYMRLCSAPPPPPPPSGYATRYTRFRHRSLADQVMCGTPLDASWTVGNMEPCMSLLFTMYTPTGSNEVF